MRYLITGGAGFLGSNLAESLLKKNNIVIVIDNFKVGKIQNLNKIRKKKNLKIIKADIKNLKKISKYFKNIDVVYHFAANADIGKAIIDPTIDFQEGTLLTKNVLEAMRLNNVNKIIYTSGSGVYSERISNLYSEKNSTSKPISPYGASKIASEAMISAYSHMFGISSIIFRFANLVGKNQTHGVVYDFIKKLKKNEKRLKILGNGNQKKSYIHVSDVLIALKIASDYILTLTKNKKKIFEIFNLGNEDSITVKDIAKLTCQALNFKNVKLIFGKNIRGWKGDVPIIKLDYNKFKKFKWKPKFDSKSAIKKTLKELI
jgi:UDP-glucose 4-epimerase